MGWSKGDEAMNETMVKVMSDYGVLCERAE